MLKPIEGRSVLAFFLVINMLETVKVRVKSEEPVTYEAC